MFLEILLSRPVTLFFVAAAMVWMARVKRLLKTVTLMPAVKPPKQAVSFSKRVSVIVPAKNEEENIAACVESLLAQDYPDFEVIVVNDNSTDKTAEILKTLQSRNPSLKVIHSKTTPPGWTGKNHALYNGYPAATGDWLLFTDADTRHESFSLSASVAHAESKGISLLTLLPRCLAEGFWENLIQPCAMAYIGLWFPIEKINAPKSPVIFGNGQFLLIERAVYEKVGTHEAVKSEFLEDFALVKKTKKAGKQIQCALGEAVYGTRMYQSFDAIWRGWRRIYLHAFERKAPVLLQKAFSVLIFSSLPFFLLPFAYPAGLLLIFCILLAAWRSHAIVKAKQPYALLHAFAALIFSLILFDAARMAATGEATKWR